MSSRLIILAAKYLGFITFLLCTSTLSSSPLPHDSTKFNYHFKKAESLKKELKFKEAVTHYKAALTHSAKLIDVLIINRNISALFYGINQLDSSRFWIDKNLKTKEALLAPNEVNTEIARSYFLLRALFTKIGSYSYSINATLKAIKILEKNSTEEGLLAAYYVDLGIGYWRLQEYERAKESLNKAIVTANKTNAKDRLITLQRSYMTLGLVYWNMRDLTKAVEHYKQVFRIINQSNESNDSNIRDYAINCSNLGLVFNDMKLYDSSVYYQKRAIVKIDLLINSPTYSVEIDNRKTMFYNNLGIALANLKHDEEAEHYYYKALESQRKQKLETHPETSKVHVNLGNLYLIQNKLDLAKNHFNKSLSIRKKYFGKSTTELCMTYNLLGDLFSKSSFKIAQNYFDSAILSNNAIKVNGEQIYTDTREIWYSFAGKTKVLTSKRRLTAEDLKEIEELYAKIKSQINYVFTRTSDSFIQADVQKLFGTLYDTYYSLYERTRDRKYLERLWEISECKKGIKLKIALNSNIALNSTIPASLLIEEKKIKDSLVFYTQKKFENKDFNDSILFSYQFHYDKFIKKLEADYPEYYKIKYALIKTSLTKVTTPLTNDKIIVNFFETSENLYSLILTFDSIFIHKNKTKDIDSIISLANHSIKSQRYNKKASYALRKKVLGDDLNLTKIKTLEVTPDGVAWQIQFSLLCDSLTKNQLDYIGKNVNIVYQYSFDSTNLADRVKKKNNHKILAFSFSDKSSSPSQNLSYVRFRDFKGNIPGTSEELRRISKTWDGDYYFSTDANESVFKKKCTGYQIIHLALHGLIDEVNPSYSMLKFNKSDSLNDGSLYSYEISAIPMNAELVVLSSCNSGAGKIKNGEGIESLGRAFSLAGVNSLLLSKWEVSDLTAPIIMNYFYQGLKKGLSKSEALRLAKVQFLEHDADNITSSPFYWDSFYIMGDDKPLSSSSSRFWSASILGGLFILVLVGWRLRRLKRI
jgi:CHAT domain-containing protein/Tfp pilus assembly protein PilF